jgi:hypothetical protein
MAGFRQYVGQSCERVNTGQAQGQPLRNAINHLKHAEIHANSSRMHPVGAPLAGALTCGSGISGFRQYAGQSCERVNTGQTQGQPLRNAINHLEHMEIHTNSPRIHPVGAALAAALTCGRGMAGFRQYAGQSCERVNTGQAQGQPLRNAINHLEHIENSVISSCVHPVGAPLAGALTCFGNQGHWRFSGTPARCQAGGSKPPGIPPPRLLVLSRRD